MSLFKGTDIICTVSSHERDEAKGFESGEDEFFLRRRNTCVDPCVLTKLIPGWFICELLQGCTSDADIIIIEEFLVKRSCGVHRNDFGFVDVTPFQI